MGESAMDAALRKALRAAGRADGCDAELAAAYAEGRLKGADRERFESHIAACTACRALATAMLDEMAPPAPPAAPVPFWMWLRWQWAVPAMAGVLIVGSAVYYQRIQTTARQAPLAQIALDRQQAREETRPVAIPVEPPPAKPASNQIAAPRRRVAAQPPAPAAEAPPPPPPRVQAEEFRAMKDAAAGQDVASRLAKNRRDEAAEGERSKPVATAEVGQQKKQEEFVTTAPAAAAPPPPPLNAAKEKAADLRESDDKNKAVAAKGVVGGVAGAATDSVQVFSGARRQQLQQASFGAYVLPNGAPVRAVAQSGNRIWAVSDGGRIFRSTDGGHTWQQLKSPTKADLTSVELESETSLLVIDKQQNRYRARP